MITKRTIVNEVAVVRFLNFFEKCMKSNKKSLL